MLSKTLMASYASTLWQVGLLLWLFFFLCWNLDIYLINFYFFCFSLELYMNSLCLPRILTRVWISSLSYGKIFLYIYQYFLILFELNKKPGCDDLMIISDKWWCDFGSSQSDSELHFLIITTMEMALRIDVFSCKLCIQYLKNFKSCLFNTKGKLVF